VLFDRGGVGETLYNAFDEETDNVTQVMRLDKADGTGCVAFVFPRTKPSSGTLGDAEATGIPVATEFAALKPDAVTFPELGPSSVYIYDTSMTGVEAPTDDLTFTFDSQAAGVATFSISGGNAPYSFEPDGAGSPVVVGKAGTFTHDYNANDNFDPTIDDSSAVTKTATVDVTINTN
jgi:hypothetical protein